MEDTYVYKPELYLELAEVNELAAICGQPGFKIANKIWRKCVDDFIGRMINADTKDEKAVLARHRDAKVAAQLYTLFLDSVNNTVYEYIHSQPSDKPVESVEGLDIDNGAYSEEDSLL